MGQGFCKYWRVRRQMITVFHNSDRRSLYYTRLLTESGRINGSQGWTDGGRSREKSMNATSTLNYKKPQETFIYQRCAARQSNHLAKP